MKKKKWSKSRIMTINDIFGQKWTFLTKFKSKCKISFGFNCGYIYFTKCVNNLIYNSKKKSNYDIL